MEFNPRTPTDDEIDTMDAITPAPDDRLDEAIIAADDTGMIAGERMITLVELDEGDSAAGDV